MIIICDGVGIKPCVYSDMKCSRPLHPVHSVALTERIRARAAFTTRFMQG